MSRDPKGFNLTTALHNYTVSYDDIGKGEIPIIFIHGFPFDKSMWQAQLDFLKSTQRAIAYDIRGFGATHDDDSDLSIDLFTDDLISFMDKLAIDKAIICGLSMGGYIALNTVKRFPDRLEALILCDTQCNADSPEAKEKRYAKMDEIASSGKSAFTEGFIKGIFHPDSLEHKKGVVEKLRSVVNSNSQYTLINGLTALAERSESCSILTDIKMPTLIICGKDDALTPVAQSEKMHKAIDGSVLRIIDNAGHVSNLEQPRDFNKHIVEFLEQLRNSEGPPATSRQMSATGD